MSRGRLIFPFRCVFAYLDTESTEAVDAGEGYDRDFREPVQVDDGSQLGYNARQEGTRTIRAQIEPATFDALRKYANGDSRDARFTIIAHFADLERAGLVDATGEPLIRVNDRLAEVREDTISEALILSVPPLPGLYVVQVMPLGFGLGKKRNLLQIDMKARTQGMLTR